MSDNKPNTTDLPKEILDELGEAPEEYENLEDEQDEEAGGYEDEDEEEDVSEDGDTEEGEGGTNLTALLLGEGGPEADEEEDDDAEDYEVSTARNVRTKRSREEDQPQITSAETDGEAADGGDEVNAIPKRARVD